MATPTAIVAYLALFAGAAAIFLLVNLVVGRFVRPNLPNEEKLEIYECGEPTIGSSFVQFDLRFYVVALLFIIFDVEVAFFFPWATVFGKSTRLAAENGPAAAIVSQETAETLPAPVAAVYRELGVSKPSADSVPYADALTLAAQAGASERVVERRRAEMAAADDGAEQLARTLSTEEAARVISELGPSVTPAEVTRDSIRLTARRLAASTIVDIGVFFAVLMVGFFYVWKRGDLDWVRSVQSQRGEVVERSHPAEAETRSTRPAGSILSA